MPTGEQFVAQGCIFEIQADGKGKLLRVATAADLKTIKTTSVAPASPAKPRTHRPGRPRKVHRPYHGGYHRFQPKPPPLVIHEEPPSLSVWLCRLAFAALVVAGLVLWGMKSEAEKWSRIGGASNAVQRR
jgi:hypothetical protein